MNLNYFNNEADQFWAFEAPICEENFPQWTEDEFFKHHAYTYNSWVTFWSSGVASPKIFGGNKNIAGAKCLISGE